MLISRSPRITLILLLRLFEVFALPLKRLLVKIGEYKNFLICEENEEKNNFGSSSPPQKKICPSSSPLQRA